MYIILILMAVSLCCFIQPLCSGRVPSTSLEVHSNICHIFSDYSEQGDGTTNNLKSCVGGWGYDGKHPGESD